MIPENIVPHDPFSLTEEDLRRINACRAGLYPVVHAGAAMPPIPPLLHEGRTPRSESASFGDDRDSNNADEYGETVSRRKRRVRHAYHRRPVFIVLAAMEDE